MNDYSPIELVKYAGEKLGDLRSKVVFLGGAVVGLLITESGARPPRPTKDVDVIAEITTLTDFYALDKILLSKGFTNDIDGPICRYLHGFLKLDVMPINPDVLGFTNRWYPSAIAFTEPYVFDGGLTINLIAAPCFLATKLEAFHDKKREDYEDIFISRDFADIVTLIDGRPSIVRETSEASAEIREFLRESFSEILRKHYLEEAIAEHVDPGREALVVARVKSIADTA